MSPAFSLPLFHRLYVCYCCIRYYYYYVSLKAQIPLDLSAGVL